MARPRREHVLSSLPEELMGKLSWVLAPFAAVAWFVLLAFNSIGAIIVLLAGISWWDRRRRLGRIRPQE